MQIGMPKRAYAIEAQEDDFQIFLAEYLDNNYMLDNLNQLMIHQYLYSYMQQQWSLANVAVTLQNMAADWGYALNGKTDIYEEIIEEIICRRVDSDLFEEQAEEKKQRYEKQVKEVILDVLDANNLADDIPELAEKLADTSLLSWQDVVALPVTLYIDNIEAIASGLKISSFYAYFLNVEVDTYDFLTDIITFLSLKDTMEGMQEVLEIMYRQTSNSELRVALKRVLDKINILNENQYWKLILESSKGYADDLYITTLKELAMKSLTIIGVGIEAGGFLSNLLFQTDTIAETQLLLEAELDIEESIKDVIRYKQNTYKNNAENARIFNNSFILLYDAYDYGIELTKQYNQAVFDVSGADEILLNSDTKNDWLDAIEQIESKRNEFKQALQAQYTYDEFNDAIHTWEGVIASDRSLFASAWLEYESEHQSETRDELSSCADLGSVTGLAFEQSQVILDRAKISNLVTYLSKPVISPSDTEDRTLIYKSSDASIVSIDKENVYGIQIHNTGTVTVTASTEDGLCSASQQLVIIDSSQSDATSTIQVDENKDYSSYYDENKDGITLTNYIDDFVDENGIFYIPESLNGKTITEIDLKSKYYDNKYGKKLKTVVLSKTVKRIADECFYGKTVTVILNEGLESIGTEAFRNTKMKDSDIIIPSTVTSVGEGAFNGCVANHIYINTAQLEEISDYCFCGADTESIIFLNEDAKLKRIGAFAFSECKASYINLPELVETFGTSAFRKTDFSLSMTHLPEGLVSIGESCFEAAVCGFDEIPESVKRIERGAFLYAILSNICLPNSIEFIGENAFRIEGLKVTCYGDDDENVKCEIEENAFYGASYLELPSSTSIVDASNFSTAITIIWTDGMDNITGNMELIVNSVPQPKRIYLKNTKRQGSLTCSDIPMFAPYGVSVASYSYYYTYDYVEISYHWIESAVTSYRVAGTAYSTLLDWSMDSYYRVAGDYSSLQNLVIVGDKENELLDAYTYQFRESIGNKLYYQDYEGNLTLLYQYQEPYYTKTSQAKYENQSDYITTASSMLTNQLKGVTSDFDITVSYDDEIKGIIGDDAIVSMQVWEDERESEANRAVSLGEFLHFEDLYLRQPYYSYFVVRLKQQDGTIVTSLSGHYVVSLQLTTNHLNQNNAGLYQVKSNGAITRVPISIENIDGICTISFETDDIGQYALVQLDTMETTIHHSYLEELHAFYDAASKDLTDKEPVTYENEKGTQTFVLKTQEESSSTTTISKPVLDDVIKEKVIERFEMDSTLIFTNQEESDETQTSIELTDKAIQDALDWQTIENSIVAINTEKEHLEVYVALSQLENAAYELHIFKVDESAEEVSLEEVSEEHIKSVQESQVPESITSNNREYYELTLDEAGEYYFMLTEATQQPQIPQQEEVPEQTQVSQLNGISIWKVVVIVLCFAAVTTMFFIIRKNRKKNKKVEK